MSKKIRNTDELSNRERVLGLARLSSSNQGVPSVILLFLGVLKPSAILV